MMEKVCIFYPPLGNCRNASKVYGQEKTEWIYGNSSKRHNVRSSDQKDKTNKSLPSCPKNDFQQEHGIIDFVTNTTPTAENLNQQQVQ